MPASPTPPAPRRRDEIDPHRTRLTAPLVVIASAAAAIAWGGFYAGSRLTELTTTIAALKEKQATAITARDLEEITQAVPGIVVTTLAELSVSCPSFVIRGSGTVVCPVVIPPSLQRLMPRLR